MNNLNRTPGVWRVDPTYPYDINCGDDIIASIETGNEYSQGDALLIAAAPDLEDLAHAFILACQADEYLLRVLAGGPGQKLYAMAEKAIMKSKGLLK